MWELATRRSVDELLAVVLVRSPTGVGPLARARAEERLRTAAARELVRERDVRVLIDAFAQASVPALLIKGAGLAYTTYSEPRLRPADDIDLLIRPRDVAAADTVLHTAGFVRQVEPDATLVSTQRHYVRGGAADLQRCVDLHWRVSNRQWFADVVEFDTAWPRARDIPSLGPGARTLDPVDALLLACTHRVAHHPGHGDLLWLLDIHLLAASLTPEQAVDLVRRAIASRVAAVVAHGMTLAQERFGTRFADNGLSQLRAVRDEPTARFIDGARRQVAWLASDLGAVGSASGRLRLLGEHLFPPLDYLQQKYPAWPRLLLPLAYIYRAVRGAPRWFRNTSAHD